MGEKQEYRKDCCFCATNAVSCVFRPKGNTTFFSVTPTTVHFDNMTQIKIIEREKEQLATMSVIKFSSSPSVSPPI